MKKILILLFCFLLPTQFILINAHSSQKEFEGFIKNPDLYNRTINYLKEVGKEASLKAEPIDIVIVTLVDLFFSFLCLWLTMVFIGTKKFFPKQYFWFLFIINLGWFIFLLIFRVVWNALDFLIIKLRPDLTGVVSDSFLLFMIITAILVYVWLLARTFNFNFFGSLEAFFISHLIYFVIIFVFFVFMPSQGNKLLELSKKNLGLRAVARTYISDVGKITSAGNILFLIRIRPFHL